MSSKTLLNPSPQTWYHFCMSLAIVGLFPVANIFHNFMPIWLVIPNTLFSVFGVLQCVRYNVMINGVKE